MTKLTGVDDIIHNTLRARAVYGYRDNTFVLLECNASFEKRQRKNADELLGKSLLDLFNMAISLLLAEVFYDVYLTGFHKEVRLNHGQHYDVHRLDNGNVVISYR